MEITKFKLLKSLSNEQIKEAILETQKELFSLRFKKATRQSFKPNKIKSAKCRLAQLKMLLSLQLNSIEKNN
jgi:large subunit ribosomal protein L29